MDLQLKGKVAIVTGASKGIGAGIARALAAEGAAVVVNYSSSKEGAQRVVDAITAAGGRAIAVGADVGKAGDVSRLFAETVRAFSRVDILVNNASVYKFEPVEQVTEAEFLNHFRTNVLGPLLTTQEALKHFPAEGGSIVNISSVGGSNPGPNSSLYSATKAAMDAMTEALAKELAARKIRVNTVAAGPTETEGAHRIGMMTDSMVNMWVSLIPMGRMGQPEDVARVVVFLASGSASWLTGETIRASGGMH